MKNNLLIAVLALSQIGEVYGQTDPAITSWMINTTGITGRHYVEGSDVPINDTAHANVQLVQYSANFSYINSSGVPAYIVGPYLDGNPALATNNTWLFKIPLNPVENLGTLTATPFGPIGLLVNGVPIYDYKDGASYSSGTGADDMMAGDGVWNRNAIEAENDGFDCAKGHPSPIFAGPPGPGGTLEGGSYHHHQNPMAFNLDLVEVSSICDLYLADGLYVIDDSQHSPLLGFAWDGFPIYGAYGYANADGTGGVTRIESSFQKRDITVRTHYADGTDVTDGPAVSPSFPLGWYREDYEFVPGSGDLDIHNGRFCVTPEYPDGIYCYFATINENWNSAYPYMVGPRYYGIVTGGETAAIEETVETYVGIEEHDVLDNLQVNIFPNPASDVIAIQVGTILKNDIEIELYDMAGQMVRKTTLNQGSTIWHIDTRTLYSGEYIMQLSQNGETSVKKIMIIK